MIEARLQSSVPGLLYVGVNAAAAAFALWLLHELWPLSNDLASIRSQLQGLQTLGSLAFHQLRAKELPFRIEEVLSAGFGSLVVLRASLMKLRVGDSDLSVGPALIPDVLLAATDRAVDRAMAAPRAAIVNNIMAGVSFEQARETLPAHCFRLMQNTTADEQQQLALEVEALTNANMSNKVKSLNLGLALLDIVGAKVLRIAVKNLENEFKASSTYLEDVKQLESLPLAWVKSALPPLCVSLASATEEKKTEIAIDVDKIDSSGLDDWTKKRLVGLTLIKGVGKDVFTSAAEELRRRHSEEDAGRTTGTDLTPA